MTTFDDREKAFEDKYKHDADLQFRVEVRRNKLLGLWIAEMLGKAGDDAESYAKEVVSSDFEEPGDDDVVAQSHGRSWSEWRRYVRTKFAQENGRATCRG